MAIHFSQICDTFLLDSVHKKIFSGIIGDLQ